MNRIRASVAAILCLILLPIVAPRAQERISHGIFKDVTLYRPQGEPRQFVLFLSGDDGWSRHTANIARVLVNRGAMVAGIGMPKLVAALEASSDACVFPDGDLENLSHYLQGYARLNTYHTPLLLGYSSGATLAYAMLAQAPHGMFAGAITLGFCADLELEKPFCQGDGVHFLRRRRHAGMDLLPSQTALDWVALHGATDEVCDTDSARRFTTAVPNAQFVLLPDMAHRFAAGGSWQQSFVDAYDKLASANTTILPAPPTTLADLPLIDVKATGNGNPRVFAVLLSGDGGWAGLDQKVAAALAAHGIPVVGLDSLRYFWRKRTPAGLAQDLDRVLRFYASHWNRSRALLIGYSQGADVLPFAVNRLPPASHSLVVQTVLLGPGEKASWEFHLGNWLGGDRDAVPIAPEASRLQADRTLCLYGAADKDALCPKLPATSVTALELPGGHHFDGTYDRLAELILDRLGNR
ncbi:AcvB/VirJ family lysyl-phosphatidylglycerol hydrolase [Povalibacter sp.]|uniref:AcvB/VirJ family lysyl-phosphatidylglycerol hydrolase n=1 Tax=Povalibacter sp. TaxID=1962978 RepID=UPI002F412FE1